METEVNFFRSSPSSQPQGDLLHPLSQLLFHFIFHFHFPVASEFDSCSELDFFSSSFFLLHDPSSPRQLHRHTLCGRLLGRSSIDLGVIHNEFSQFKQQLVRPLYSLSFSFFIFYFLFFIFHFFFFPFFIFFPDLCSQAQGRFDRTGLYDRRTGNRAGGCVHLPAYAQKGNLNINFRTGVNTRKVFVLVTNGGLGRRHLPREPLLQDPGLPQVHAGCKAP